MMKITSTFFCLFFLFSLSINAKGDPKNHPFSKVEIAYSRQGCSFQSSAVDFCDEKHISAITSAIDNKTANFNGHYILISIDQGLKIYRQRSIVAIDVDTGIAYPVPIDAYSGHTNKDGWAKSYGKLNFYINKNRLCINGAIIVHEQIDNGKFCFFLNGNKFSGYHTTYMNDAES